MEGNESWNIARPEEREYYYTSDRARQEFQQVEASFTTNQEWNAVINFCKETLQHFEETNPNDPMIEVLKQSILNLEMERARSCDSINAQLASICAELEKDSYMVLIDQFNRAMNQISAIGANLATYDGNDPSELLEQLEMLKTEVADLGRLFVFFLNNRE